MSQQHNNKINSPALSSGVDHHHHDDASPYCVGDIIWLKIPGCPYWPSKVGLYGMMITIIN